MNIDELHCIAHTNFIKQQCRSIRLFTKLNEISWLSIITLLDKLLRFTIPKIRLWLQLIGISFDENLTIYFPNRNHIQIMWKFKLCNKLQNRFWFKQVHSIFKLILVSKKIFEQIIFDCVLFQNVCRSSFCIVEMYIL